MSPSAARLPAYHWTLERMGVPRSVAKKIMGHKTDAMYNRYAIGAESDLPEAFEKLSKIKRQEKEEKKKRKQKK